MFCFIEEPALSGGAVTEGGSAPADTPGGGLAGERPALASAPSHPLVVAPAGTVGEWPAPGLGQPCSSLGFLPSRTEAMQLGCLKPSVCRTLSGRRWEMNTLGEPSVTRSLPRTPGREERW